MSKENTLIYYTDPVFNEAKNLFEIKKLNENDEVLDIIADSDQNALLTKKEQLVKEYIMSQINKDKPQAPTEVKGRKVITNKVGEVVSSKEEIIKEIIARKLSGESLYEITKNIGTEFQLSNLAVGKHVVDAMQQIKERTAEQIDEILELHLSRYEELYRWFKTNGYLKFAVKALRAKEGLMGIGQDTVVGVQVNNYFGVEGSSNSYHIDQLKEEQKKRLSLLMKKIVQKP